MIADKSFRFILPPLILGLIIIFFSLLIGILIIGFAFYLIWFFRDPYREIILNNKLIYAPADGKVIFLETNPNSLKIAIRMSPFNVHLNRSPIKATVVSIEHTPGHHRTVYFGDIENKNERNLIKLSSQDFDCEILQITGAIARRIECWIDENSNITQGQKIGMIRFGSQTNMYIISKRTSKSIKLLVNLGDRVSAGLTVVAEIRDVEVI